MKIRKAIVAGVAVVGAALGGLGAAGPASAASGDGVINWGEFVLWRDSNYSGPLYDAYNNIYNYSGYYFVNSVTQLNDRASSIANYDQTYSVRTYVNAGYAGSYISVLPYGQASGSVSYAYYSLGSFNDQLSSHQFL